MVFKKLPLKEKYEKVLKFTKKNKRLPKYNSKDKLERTYYIFITNKKNLIKRGEKGLSHKIFKWEQAKIKQIESCKEDINTKLKLVLEYCKKNKKIPQYLSPVEDEKNMARKFNCINNSAKTKQLVEEQLKLLEEILEYKNDYQKSKKEKMEKLLDFCKEKNRSPKQHVKDENEKRLAEFFTTLKTLHKKNKLDDEEKKILDEVLKYSPPPRKKPKKPD